MAFPLVSGFSPTPKPCAFNSEVYVREDEQLHIGILRVKLFMRSNRSLKEKRHVLRKVKDKVRHHFNASVAEVAQNDEWKIAVLGITVVANDAGLTNTILQKIFDTIDHMNVAELVDRQHRIEHFKDTEFL